MTAFAAIAFAAIVGVLVGICVGLLVREHQDRQSHTAGRQQGWYEQAEYDRLRRTFETEGLA